MESAAYAGVACSHFGCSSRNFCGVAAAPTLILRTLRRPDAELDVTSLTELLAESEVYLCLPLISSDVPTLLLLRVLTGRV